jgi:glycosyltransferase involved in cell wall biosynthesis
MAPLATALVHDYLLVMRGAERTFAAMADCWPEAPVYTMLYDREGTEGTFADRRVETSYLQRMGVRQAGFRRLLPLFPSAMRSLNVADYDLIVSSSSAFAHGVRTGPNATHVCYCHTPFRYAWFERDRVAARLPRAFHPLVQGALGRLRAWDRRASQGVTHYVTNSELSRTRIQESFGRDATVVHPPVEVDRFSIGAPEDFFLVVTELVPHKRVTQALEAARLAGVPMKVVGGGLDLKRLKQEYGSTAEFLGRASDAQLTDLYRRARALVVPNIEEFGIAAVEAQASGRPVLAADAGGAKETVVPGETGVRVPVDDVEALAEAMREVDWEGFDPGAIRERAMRFSPEVFKRRFTEEVARVSGKTDRPAHFPVADIGR